MLRFGNTFVSPRYQTVAAPQPRSYHGVSHILVRPCSIVLPFGSIAHSLIPYDLNSLATGTTYAIQKKCPTIQLTEEDL